MFHIRERFPGYFGNTVHLKITLKLQLYYNKSLKTNNLQPNNTITNIKKKSEF